MPIEFEIKHTPTIMDGLVIRHKLDYLEVSSSRNGVMIGGQLITTEEDINKIKSEIHKCWIEHIKIKSGEVK